MSNLAWLHLMEAAELHPLDIEEMDAFWEEANEYYDNLEDYYSGDFEGVDYPLPDEDGYIF